MTPTAASTTPAAVVLPPGPTRRAARALVPLASGQAIWWWLAPVVLFAVVPAMQPAWLDEATVSLWQFILYAPVVGTFATAVLLVASHLPLYLANGIDRRSYTCGAALAAMPAMLASSGVAAGGFALERATLLPTVAEPALVDAHLYTATDQYTLVVLEMVLVLAAAWCTGWLVAVGYYRLGWLRGSFVLPFALLPAILVPATLALDRVPGTMLGLGVPGRLAIAVALLAMTAAVVDRTTRGLELRGTTTWLVTG